MSARRLNPFRWLTVLVLAAAWIAATNHCAVAMLAERVEKSASGECSACHKALPGSQKIPIGSAEMGCCKVFKSLAEMPAPLVKSPDCWTALDFLLPEQFPAVAGSISGNWCSPAHGPPGVASFAVVQFQRGHPAFAPPSLA